MAQLSASGRGCALVTGASSGLGLAFAERLASEGYDLILVARRLSRLKEIAARLHQTHGVAVEALGADLSDAGALSEVEAVLGKNDSLALLINSAGFAGFSPFALMQTKVIDDLTTLYVRALAHTTRAALPGMIRRGRGAIINISGLLGLASALPPSPLPPRAVFAGAKAFILAFTQTLAAETRGTGVRIQVCIPGLMETDFHAAQGIDTSKMTHPMSAEDVVTASLSALEHDEIVCIPGLADPKLWDGFMAAQLAVFRSAVVRSTCAERYRTKPR